MGPALLVEVGRHFHGDNRERQKSSIFPSNFFFPIDIPRSPPSDDYMEVTEEK